MEGRSFGAHRSWREAARKLVCASAIAAIATVLVPAEALAAVTTDDNDNVTYTLPTRPMAVQKQLTDSKGNRYTQETITVCAAQPPMRQPYYSLIGISNTMLGRGLNNPKTFAQAGLFGSDANVAPDEYLYNYCVYMNDDAGDVTVPADIRALGDSTVQASIDGTEYNMPREIYTETNMIQVASSGITTQGKTYADWVKLENQRSNRSKSGTYDPKFVSFTSNSGGTYTMSESLYTNAETADELIEQSKDENGNYTLATRYAEGPNTVNSAISYEDITKGTEYYVLSKIADKTISKATVAVICGYDTTTNNYAVRVLNPEGVKNDQNSNQYGGRIASAVNQIATDMNTLKLPTAQEPFKGTVNGRDRDETSYVRWYTPQQIVENCDACFVTDAPGTNGVSNYLATGTEQHANTVSSDENMQALVKAQADAKSSGKKAADICYKWPASLFGVWYAQGCENAMMNFITAAYLYPNLFDLTDVMAWWAKNLWHITDASLQDMVDSTCYKISLSSNQSRIGTISPDYKAKIDSMIKAGNQYYLDNIAEVNAINNGNIKTHNIFSLAKRSGVSTAEAYKDCQKAGMAGDAIVNEAVKAGMGGEILKAAADQANRELAAARSAQKSAEKKANAIRVVSVNKATVRATDFKQYKSATTAVLGVKVRKISASVFKGSKIKTVLVMSKKLTKSGVKNSMKGSKVSTVQVPSGKKKSYSKIFTKKNCGKKVTVS